MLAAALIGSVAADLAMLRFWRIAQGQTHHHRFLAAYPAGLAWPGIAAPGLAWLAQRRLS